MERPAEKPAGELTKEPAEPAEPGDALDLTSIGLTVFFVSLIVVVGALLILPAVF